MWAPDADGPKRFAGEVLPFTVKTMIDFNDINVAWMVKSCGGIQNLRD
jgi:hypothetical protein